MNSKFQTNQSIQFQPIQFQPIQFQQIITLSKQGTDSYELHDLILLFLEACRYGCLVNLCYDSTDFRLNALAYLLERKPSLELVRLMKDYGAESI